MTSARLVDFGTWTIRRKSHEDGQAWCIRITLKMSARSSTESGPAWKYAWRRRREDPAAFPLDAPLKEALRTAGVISPRVGSHIAGNVPGLLVRCRARSLREGSA